MALERLKGLRELWTPALKPPDIEKPESPAVVQKLLHDSDDEDKKEGFEERGAQASATTNARERLKGLKELLAPASNLPDIGNPIARALIRELPASKPPVIEKPITQALVREILYDPDDEDSKQVQKELGAQNSATAKDYATQKAPNDEIDVWMPQPALGETRSWLERLVNEEGSKQDWSPEYKPRHLEPYPEPNKLPIFVKEETHDAVLYWKRVIIKHPIMSMKTQVLERIDQGLGPRPAKYEDLIAKLRLDEPAGSKVSTKSSFVEETYTQMQKILEAWNEHVGAIPDEASTRSQFLKTLQERSKLLLDIEQGGQKRNKADEQLPYLQHALHAFRPEIAKFQNQNVTDNLIMMFANTRIASPDLDEEMKCALMKTLYMEVTMPLRFDPDYQDRRHSIKARKEAAIRKGDHEDANLLTQALTDLRSQGEAHRIEEGILDKIRYGRHQLRLRQLEELQKLTELSAAQKWASADVMVPPAALVKRDWEKSAAAVYRAYGDMLDAEDLCETESANVATMLSLIRDCHSRTRKFAALDIKNPVERERVKKGRMENLATAGMMLKVVVDTGAAAQMPAIVLKHMDGLEDSLGKILEAATSQYRTMDSLLPTIFDEDPEFDGSEEE